MTYLLIGVILIAVIAPFLAVLPSAGQKARMAKRKILMGRGIRIDLTRMEDPDPDPEKYLSSTGRPLERVIQVAACRLPRRNYRDSRNPIKWSIERTGKGPVNGWFWVQAPGDFANDIKEFVERELSNLPNDVLRVEEGGNLLSLYWLEKGEAEAVAHFLEGCAAVKVRPVESDL